MARSWKFTVGAATYEATTDFWVEYQNSGDPPAFAIVLHSVWERLGVLAAVGLPKRAAVEDRLQALVNVAGREGTLVIDDGEPSEKTFSKVTLQPIDPQQADNNLMLEYDLTFSKAAGAGQLLARKWTATAYENLNPGAEPDGTDMGSDTDFLIVTQTQDDRTVFKDVFRGAPVRIPSGPAIKVITLTGIRQQITAPSPDTLLKRRQAAEALIADMLPNVGKQFDLLIDEDLPNPGDGVDLGRVHLRAVRPGRLDLPDAVTYDLEFVSGYVD
jgi:hypothetical protein